MCLDYLFQKVMNIKDYFKTPQHSKARRVQSSTSTPNEDTSSEKWTHNVRRRLIFEENEENEENEGTNAFIKLSNVQASNQNGYNKT